MKKYFSDVLGFKALSFLAFLGLLTFSFSPVFAATLVNVGAKAGVPKKVGAPVVVHATTTTSIPNTKNRADVQIETRISALNKLITRIQSMKKVSSTDQASLTASINDQISTMTNLRTTIDNDTSTTSLRADVQSITKSYRIYILVVPQVAIEAEADRVENIVSMMTTISTKLETRISGGQKAGKDTTEVSAMLSDYNSKIADANVQAQAAVTEVASLTPDQGDQTKMQANLAALKDARTKLQAATVDLKTADKDAKSIISTVVSWHLNAGSVATSTT